MDPFVTQIGDVTIQRLTPQGDVPEEEKSELAGDASSTNVKDSSGSPQAENDVSSSHQSESQAVETPESEPANQKFKTASSPDSDEKETEGKNENETMDIKDEETANAENQEDSEEEKKCSEEFNKEGLKGKVEDGGEPLMDASRFLEMAQAEGGAMEGNADELSIPTFDSFQSVLSDHGEDSEKAKSEIQENEDVNEGGNSERILVEAKSEPIYDDDDDDDEVMQDDDVNGAMDSSYADQDYDGMEAEDMTSMKDQNAEDLKFDLGQSIKTEPGEKSDQKADNEDDEEQGEGVMKKKLRRQKRKILKEDDTDESEEERKKKRKKRKKKGATGDGSETSEETESEDDGSGKKKKKKKKKPTKKTKKKDDDDGSGGEKEKKSSNMRRNIRDVMDETQLDEATVAAQRQEMERLRRVQEQQRILREMAQQRQQQQRAEQKVMSLLQGNTSILKQVTVGPSQPTKSSASATSPNTVVVKVGSGVTAQANKKVLELLRVPKGTAADVKPSVTKTLLSKPQSLQGTTMMTPSVSIAPVRPGAALQKAVSLVKQPSLIQAQASYSASEEDEDEMEGEEIEGEGEEEGELEGEIDEDEILEEVDEDGKKKKKDVVTISSSSEDDCIVLSEPSDIGEDEDEEDPTNSGMHTNDAYNVPDEEGRVQVNMGKPEGDPDIYLAPHIGRIIKPHQIGGIRFLYDNVIESIERFSTSTGFGCILAHSMGLGKTLQVITFCDIFLRHTPAKTVMCIMPINTLQNWLAEFNMWMPDDPLATPLAAQGEVRPRTFNIHVLNDSHKTLKARAKVVEDWSTGGGVLLIGYELYRQLSLKKVSKPKKSRRKKMDSDEEELDAEEQQKRQKEILEKVYEALVKPGPDLVICDEGHRIKNSHASISMALKQIRSKRRIVLTGYPLQNNLLEYWCMVDFVRPNYLGTKTEFCNMFERPIQNGQCIDSTPQDIRLMRYRAHVLHSLLEGFVQRRSHAVLQSALPQKEEYVLLVRLNAFQRKLYETFMNEVVRTKAVPNPLKAFAVCCKIWNHPDVLYQFLKKREGGEGVDLDLEEAAAAIAANTVADPTGTPVEELKASGPKPRNRAGAPKGRKKKDLATSNKPAAAVLPNTSSQNESSGSYGISGQYSMHGQGQLNSSSVMGSYNPYSSSGHGPYGSFNSSSHHYNPSSSYGHSGYSGAPGFNSSSSSMALNTPGQGSFSGSGSSGYGDSLATSPASQSSQYGSSSSQSMFNNSTSSNPSAPGTPGYGSMGPPYFSGNSPSGQHSMTDGFSSSSNYNQSWSGSSNYNSFNQGPSGSQSFPGSSYNSSGQNPPFQGYGSSSSSSFNQSMYGSGSGASSGNASQSYQPGMIDQQLLDQNLMAPPNRPNANPNLIAQQSPVNASGMLPGGAPTKRTATVPHDVILQQSPINASGMLPGGAPTKNPALMPPGMSSSLLGQNMGVGMGNAPGMSGMGDNMISHHSQGMGMSNVYQNPSMMSVPAQPPNPTQSGPMTALSSIASADVPPSAEDLLQSTHDDFRAFDPSIGKTEAGRGIFDVKDRTMFDPWGNSQSQAQDYNLMSSRDVKPLQNSGMKKSDGDKFNAGPSPLEQLKSDMGEVKLEDKASSELDHKDIGLDSGSGVNSSTEPDTKASNSADSWKVDSMEIADKDKEGTEEIKDKDGKDEEEEGALDTEGKPPVEPPAIVKQSGKEDPGIPYDWAVELMKDYVPGLIEASAKMTLFFCILEESLAMGDRILLFSQSLFTLSLIEEYLQRSFIPVPGVYERWQRNRTYFRLDGSTAAIEREKLINEFNANPNVYLFLVSTRAGSLGINLVGANRVIVFDASWNPCHDTQAVCRVYRYGQKKPCFVYRFVMDNCLEKKIYDRQINKQGMSDRVVDECNPDAHLSIKEVTNLCWDDEKETEIKELGDEKDKFNDSIMQKILEKHGKLLTKAPFQHESLLVDRKDKKLSQAEKRLAKRSYEMEKRAANRPVYNYYNPAQGGLQIRPVQRDAAGNIIKPIASVRPMQSDANSSLATGNRSTKWIPAEVWQRQGMSAQEMTLPLDVVIPTNSPERSSIVLKAGQRVMVLKSPKGIYMQLENGKIIAIRTAFKMGANNKTDNKPFAGDKEDLKKVTSNIGLANKGNIKLTSGIHPLRNNPNITITPRSVPGAIRPGVRPILNRTPGVRLQTTANMRPWVRPGGVAGRAVPLRPTQNMRPGLRGLSPSVTVTPANPKARNLGPVTITPRLAPANFLGGKAAENSKDKAKTESKNEMKNELRDKFESDDGQSSNSSLDVPSNSSKASMGSDSIPLKAEDEGLKEKDDQTTKDGIGFDSLSVGKSTDMAKSFDDKTALENKSPSGLSDNQAKMSTKVSKDQPVNSLSDSMMKGYHQSSSNQRHPDVNPLSGQDSRESTSGNVRGQAVGYSGSGLFNPSEKVPAQSSSINFPTNYSSSSSSSVSKQFNPNLLGGSVMSRPNYSAPAEHRASDSKSSNSVENQWKSPSAAQAFSPGVPSSKSSTHQRSLDSKAYDNNSNTSAHSSISSKSSSALSSSVEPRAQSSVDAGHSSFGATDHSSSLSKSSSKPAPAAVSSATNLSSSSASKLNPPTTNTSSNSSISTSSSNFPALDPYGMYGSYGAYPGGLPSSNYYSPYSYPPGFLPDPKSSLSTKSSAETNPSASTPSSRSSSKSSSRTESRKTSQESSRSSQPAAYDSRQPSSSSTSITPAHSSRSGSTSSSTTSGSSSFVPDPAAYSSGSSAVAAAAAAAAYNPMMMSPSFNPTSSQFPPPSAATSTSNPFTAAAAAAANYPSPYASPYGYPGTDQFGSDLARASMYSAFHRPDAGLDPTSPYLPLPAHSRPVTGTPSSAGSFYSQNVYGSQYGGTRDPYSQLPPYPASPLFMPPAAYSGLASSASSSATSDQSPSQ